MSNSPESDEVNVDGKSGDRSESTLAREADGCAGEGLDRQRKEMDYQKRSDRPPGPTTGKFGKPEITDGNGTVVVRGTEAVPGACADSMLQAIIEQKDVQQGNINFSDLSADEIRKLQDRFGSLRDGPWDGDKSVDSNRELLDLVCSEFALLDTARLRIKDSAERERFNNDMDAFIKRAHKDGVSNDQIIRTLRKVGELIDGEQKEPIDQATRVKIAEQVMDQLARPTTIDQGAHNTCNVTSIESMMYTTEPYEAVRAVTEMATRGSYMTKDGHQVKMFTESRNPDGTIKTTYDSSLNPDPEAAAHLAPGASLTSRELDGQRSYASQLFQLAAVNTFWSQCDTLPDGTKAKVQPGSLRYVQRSPSPPGDSGERLIDCSKDPPVEIKDKHGEVYSEPHLTIARMALVYRRMTGNPSEGKFLEVNPRVTNASGEEVHNGVTFVRDEAQLQRKLAELKRNGSYPVVVGVNVERLSRLGGESKPLPPEETGGGAQTEPVFRILPAEKDPGAIELYEINQGSAIQQNQNRTESGVSDRPGTPSSDHQRPPDGLPDRRNPTRYRPDTIPEKIEPGRLPGSDVQVPPGKLPSDIPRLRKDRPVTTDPLRDQSAIAPVSSDKAVDDLPPDPSSVDPDDVNTKKPKRHAVTIRDPEESGPEVKVGLDNQWGNPNDFLGRPATRPKLTVHQLYDLMRYKTRPER